MVKLSALAIAIVDAQLTATIRINMRPAQNKVEMLVLQIMVMRSPLFRSKGAGKESLWRLSILESRTLPLMIKTHRLTLGQSSMLRAVNGLALKTCLCPCQNSQSTP